MSRGYYRAKGTYYKMTPKRKAALRKAQLASARKRRRNKVIKRAAIGTGVAIGVGAGAYLGVKHPATIKKAGAKTAAKTRAAVQPLVKEANRVHSGLTKGFRRGAGPDAGASTPQPRRNVTGWDHSPWAHKHTPRPQRDTSGYTHTVIPQISWEEAEALQNAADPSAWERANRQWNRQWRKLQREKKTGQTEVRGVPRALVFGKKLSQKKAWKIISRASEVRATGGGEGFTQAQKVAILNQMIADGSVQKNLRGRAARRNLKIPGITGKSTLRRRDPAAPPRSAEDYKEWVFNQLAKHGKLDF